ncbi:MAG: hypothetical protein Kapaf2KO_20780 [Candidatus Kapaibacteriales bacterium]
MPVIHLRTEIKADIEIVFDLSRSIDLHIQSSKKHNEQAIAGRKSGLIELGETVTWKAKHLGFYHKLTSIITELERPHKFADEQLKGIFKKFKHEHTFEKSNNKTILIDKFDYTSPLGILGKIADFLIVEKHMRNYLIHRNKIIKEYAESDKWKALIR